MSKIFREGTTFTTNMIAGSRGGDLSSFIGIHNAAVRYEEERQPGKLVRDRHGFVNESYREEAVPDVVVVGDSFMTVGRVDDVFAMQLAAHSGLFVYNRALMGHGPFLSVENFLDDPRFQMNPPRFLIWGFAEREVAGKFFNRFYYGIQARVSRVESRDEQKRKAPPSVRRLIVHWDSFSPDRLQHSLPASSLLAESSQWVWNRIRYFLFRKINPDLIPVDDVLGESMLFYRYHVDALTLSEESHEPDTVVKAIVELNRLCRIRGMQLVVVLIPEKEQVYRNWLPDWSVPPDGTLPPSILWTIESSLKSQDVRVVNLLPVFDNATKQGRRVYWRDDTHWNPAGVNLAAEQVWNVIQDVSRQGQSEWRKTGSSTINYNNEPKRQTYAIAR